MAITRLWQCGFEANTTAEYDGGYWSIQAGGRSGSYQMRLEPSNGNATYRYFVKNVAATRQLRVGFAVNMNNIGTTDGEILRVRNGATALLDIKVENASNDIELRVDGVQQDVTIDSPLTTSTWMHFGVDCKIHATTGWVYVYLNGVEILSFEGDTGDVDIDSIWFGSTIDIGGGTMWWYYDDCYIDDTTGEGTPAVCPLLKFEWIYPNATGNYDQWVGSDGNNVNNYQLVDERPPVTSDYVEEDTVDELDSYAMTTYTLGAGEQIDAVIPMAYAQRYGASEELALGTRYSGTDVIGSDQDPGFGAWSFVWERQTAKPGGGAWTQAALDAVEAVIKSRGTF